MNKYELVIILDAALPQEEKETICNQVLETVNKSDAKVINSQVWLEKHKLAFILKRCTEGTYYLINFESKGENIVKIRKLLRINERVLRFKIVKVEKTNIQSK